MNARVKRRQQLGIEGGHPAAAAATVATPAAHTHTRAHAHTTYVAPPSPSGIEGGHPAAAAAAVTTPAAHTRAHAHYTYVSPPSPSDSGDTSSPLGDTPEVPKSNVSLMSEVDDLKARLASTATQLTTTEDELRQKVEMEGSLRFAVDVLRTRLGMRKARNGSNGNKGGGGNKTSRASSGQRCPDGDDGEIESVKELLTDLGLTSGGGDAVSSDPRVDLVARDIEDTELRIEGLKSRLSKSEQARRQVEELLAEREVTVQSLQSKIDSLRTKLAETERVASTEKARLEEELATYERSETELRNELDHFKAQLELVAGIKVAPDENTPPLEDMLVPQGTCNGSADKSAEGIKPFDEKSPNVGSKRDYQRETHCVITPDKQQMQVSNADVLEARAKAKVLLSLRKEADLSYQGAIDDLEKMIAQVYTRELQNEIQSRSGGAGKDGAPGIPKDRGLEQLHDMSTKKLDQVSNDFKKLLAARDRMLTLQSKIQKQCNAILSVTDTTNEMELGEWDVSQTHPVLPGAC